MVNKDSLTKQQLRELLAQKDEQLERQDDVIRQQDEKITQWETAYDKLWRERFDAKSERYIDDPNQLRIDFGNSAEAEDAANGLHDAIEDVDLIAAHRRRKPRKKRDERLPEHFERREFTATISEDIQAQIDDGELKMLPESMWDVTEMLMMVPPSFWVKRMKYPKWVSTLNPEGGIYSPERPTGIVEGNKYDTSVAAQIITAKFGYHLPVYRQQDIFAGSGWTPARSTLLNILTNCHFVIEPLLAYFSREVLRDEVIGCDDTSVTLLYPKELPEFNLDDPKERRIHEVFSEALEQDKPSVRGKMWAYRGETIKLNVFDFRVSRHRDGPEEFFENYQGTLVGDCYSGFERIVLDSDGAMMRAACNAHARRKIEESTAYPADRKHWLLWYQELFDIETRGKVMSSDERRQLRQAEAGPLWNEIETWLEEVQHRTKNVVLPKSDFGKALQYIRNHLAELKRYVDDPLVPIDNNQTEQLMKQIAVGRKNWIFAGSVRGGERNAGFFTLVSSAVRNDLDPWLYVKDVLDQLLAGCTDYEPLLPWNWAKDHPAAIRNFRVEERQQRAATKQTKRADRRKKLKHKLKRK